MPLLLGWQADRLLPCVCLFNCRNAVICAKIRSLERTVSPIRKSLPRLRSRRTSPLREQPHFLATVEPVTDCLIENCDRDKHGPNPLNPSSPEPSPRPPDAQVQKRRHNCNRSSPKNAIRSPFWIAKDCRVETLLRTPTQNPPTPRNKHPPFGGATLKHLDGFQQVALDSGGVSMTLHCAPRTAQGTIDSNSLFFTKTSPPGNCRECKNFNFRTG